MTNRDRTGRQATEVMKYVTVLDFETGRVHMYTVDKNDWNPDEEPLVEFLQHVGHNLANIEYMVHSDKRVVTSLMLTKENSFTN
tara:strand:+ start:788 stop:1039 length:252 start_codon:yes stop_codon:yes gene_type:complete